jgi:hypothetical protein
MKNNKHIESFGQFNENLNISDVSDSKIFNIRKDISDVRDYIMEHNDDGSHEYQSTITKLVRIEQYIIDNTKH